MWPRTNLRGGVEWRQARDCRALAPRVTYDSRSGSATLLNPFMASCPLTSVVVGRSGPHCSVRTPPYNGHGWWVAGNTFG
jgi:hypothetical protein